MKPFRDYETEDNIGGTRMTIHIQPANHWSEAAATFAQINAVERSHIGYCGTDPAEIEATLREDFKLNEILFAYEKGEIVGVLAFDYDVDDKQADVWGPFLQENQSVEVAKRLWDAHPLTSKKWSFHFFINTKNRTATQFVTSILGAKQQGIHLALIKEKQNHTQSALPPIEIDLTNADEKEAFIQLHRSAFPRAYYSGEEIISRLDHHKRLFLSKHDDHVSGYVYLEANPEFGEGSVEFIAVDPVMQKRSIGRELLNQAIDFLFKEESIQDLALTVSTETKGAIRLYRSVGFHDRYELAAFQVDLTS